MCWVLCCITKKENKIIELDFYIPMEVLPVKTTLFYKVLHMSLIACSILCMVVVVGCATDQEAEPTVVETFEKVELTEEFDPYDEWLQHTYYKMSDGTWKVDITNDEDGSIETRSYKYRIVVHGRMPNAAVESNYILLSNRTDITFKQTWLASGLSSNMDDYFDLEETIFVSTWLGDLETNHPVRDEDTIYVIEADN